MPIANPQNTYRGNIATPTNMSVFIPEIWGDMMLRQFDATLVMSKYVKHAPDKYKSGKKLHIPRVGRLRANAKVAETPVQLQAYTETEFTMEVKRYYESSFATEDIGRLQSDYNLVAEYAREAAYALSYDVDNWLLGYRPVLKKAGQVISTGAGNPLNRAAILLARLRLDQARIPQEGRYWMISPAQHTSLLTIPEFINTDYVNDKPTVSGVVGYLYGDPVIVNNNLVKNTLNGIDLNVGRGAPQLVPTPGYGVAGNFSPWIPNATLNGDPNGAGQENLVLADLLTVNAYSAMYCHPDWLMMWMPQAPKSETDRMVTFQADAVVNTIFYDAKVYRPECGLIVESFETA